MRIRTNRIRDQLLVASQQAPAMNSPSPNLKLCRTSKRGTRRSYIRSAKPWRLRPRNRIPRQQKKSPPIPIVKILLVVAVLAGVVLIVLEVPSLLQPKPPVPYIDLGSQRYDPAGLSGRLVARWETSGSYQLFLDPIDPQQVEQLRGRSSGSVAPALGNASHSGCCRPRSLPETDSLSRYGGPHPRHEIRRATRTATDPDR